MMTVTRDSLYLSYIPHLLIKYSLSTPHAHAHTLFTRFPTQVQLLQSLPVPSGDSGMTSSLYDWISTHVRVKSFAVVVSNRGVVASSY